LNHMFELFNDKSDEASSPNGSQLVTKVSSFSKFDFHAPRDIFNKVSFTIRPNTSTAIVGPSGSGKSRIVQLLNRFYDPSEVSNAQGTIYQGKDDIKSKDLTALRGMIGYVSQEPVLILGTIRDNLLFCNKDATEEDME